MRHPEDLDAGPAECESTPQQEETGKRGRFTALTRRWNLNEHLLAARRFLPELRPMLRGRYTVVSLGLTFAVLIAALSIFHMTQATSTMLTTATSGDRDVPERAGRHERSIPDQKPASPSQAPAATQPPPTAAPSPSAQAPPPPPPPPAWVLPIKAGYSITTGYEWRWGAFHDGADLAAPHGTPIYAVGAGTIEVAGDLGDGYGIKVLINHHNGFKTLYGHLSAATVNVGQHVEPDQHIGSEGSTGFSTGPHLHFGVYQHNGASCNPFDFLREREVNLG